MESEEEIKSIFWIGTAVMLTLAIGLLFLGLYYQNYLAKMKRKEAELLLKTTLESEHKERQRIAADLHDGLQGDLNAIRVYLTVLQKQETDPNRQLLYGEIKAGVDTAFESTRQISYKLMPPLLDSEGLLAALDDYFLHLKRTTGILFDIKCNEKEIIIAKSYQYELFRLLQELTTNMIKHGTITICQIIIYSINEFCYLEIIDDGIPFNITEALVTSKGTGMKNINMRLKVINAEITQREVVAGNHYLITIKK